MILRILAIVCFLLVALTALVRVELPALPIVALGLALWALSDLWPEVWHAGAP